LSTRRKTMGKIGTMDLEGLSGKIYQFDSLYYRCINCQNKKDWY